MQPIQHLPRIHPASPAMPMAPYRANDLSRSSVISLSQNASCKDSLVKIWRDIKIWFQKLFSCCATHKPFIPGQPVGLINPGNSCWLNTMVQIAAHSPNFERLMQGVNGFPQLLVNYRNAQNAGQTVMPGSDAQVFQLRQAMHAIAPGLISNEDRQEDFGEALTAPLQIANNNQPPFFMVQDGDELLNQFVVARRDGDIIQNPDNIIHLNFAGGNEHRLEPLFINTFLNNGLQVRRFAQTPPELMMQIHRFAHQRRPWYAFWENEFVTRKLSDNIIVPQRFQVQTRWIDGAVQPQNYELNWFVIHGGSTMDSGHYSGGVKDNQGRWWHISDSEVTLITEEYALRMSQEAYFVDYRHIP